MNGIPQIRKLGAAFIFQPDPMTVGAVTTAFPFYDLGTLPTRTAKTDNGEDKIMDDREGSAVPITIVQPKYDPTFELETNNSATAMLQLYYRATLPSAWTQSGSTATDIAHKAWPSSAIKILDTNGVPQQMVASITNLKVGSTTAVRGVDYDYVPGDLDRGFVYALPTSTLITQAALAASSGAGVAITITYVLAAVTAGLTFDPLSGPCTMEGYGEVHAAACEGKQRWVDTGRFSVVVPELLIPMDKVAGMKFTVTKLTNYGSNHPRGQVFITKG